VPPPSCTIPCAVLEGVSTGGHYREGGEEALKIKKRGRRAGGKLLGWQAATICNIISGPMSGRFNGKDLNYQKQSKILIINFNAFLAQNLRDNLFELGLPRLLKKFFSNFFLDSLKGFFRPLLTLKDFQ